MPGLSQLKKFNADILSLGNEPALRAARGEKPVTVPIPKSVKDVSDADDFVMGMPEPVESVSSTQAADNGPEDFSDIMGTSSASENPAAETEGGAGPAINFAMPDITSLGSFDEAAGGAAPDLSMFDEPVETPEEEPEPEPEPEEPDIADMGLDALLGGTGFDGSEGEGEAEPDSEGEAENADGKPVEGLDTLEEISDAEAVEPLDAEPVEDIEADKSVLDAASIADAALNNAMPEDEPLSFDAPAPGETFDADSLELPDNPDEPEGFKNSDFGGIDDLNLDSLDFGSEPAGDSRENAGEPAAEFEPDAAEIPENTETEVNSDFEMPEVPDNFEMPEIPDVPETPETTENAGEPAAENPESGSEFDLSDIPDLPDEDKGGFGDLGGFDLDSMDIPEEGSDSGETAQPETETETAENSENAENPDSETAGEETAPEGDDFEFDGSAIDMGEGLPESMTETDEAGVDAFKPVENDAAAEQTAPDVPEDDFSMEPPAEDAGDTASETADISGEEAPSAENADTGADTDTEASDEDISSETPAGLFNTADFDMPDLDADTANTSDFDIGSIDIDAPETNAEEPLSTDAPAGEENQEQEQPASESPDNSASADDNNDFPTDFNFNLDDTGDDAGSGDGFQESAPAEKFDTTEMEGLDFGIPDTDAALEKGNFELGNSDDFAADAGEFEIPGFSDVQTVEVTKNGRIKVPTKEEEKPVVESEEELPPNTLSDEQYEKFLKNLAAYPLNVRMAVEELIVKNEFTDEAEFGIIEKILKKVSARALAAELEKMLDKTISVPRDFERRTAEEYEAYKQSFQYQLANKIIPGAIVSIAAVIVAFFLFEFGKYFIYKPARANSLYRQGYTLLQNEDFPQSETKFNAAVKYQLQKKWFFKYARGYKDHKQYIRAEQMYRNILYCFNHDKEAGLEYAGMETYDLANYESAEKVLLREVLDYHINDADGILALGDNYLEWATEKDPAKFDEALKRYSELVQLYGATDTYLARMLRYYIRTDKLRDVLQLKNTFFPRPKSLEGCDWTDLSGYCLDKLYGPLSPSDEYLRGQIEDVKEMLVRAVKTDGKNPVAYYNLSKYYINTNNSGNAEKTLNETLKTFEKVSSIKKRDLYKYIDSYRLLGEIYVASKDYLKALESFTSGVGLYTEAHNASGFEGTKDIGKLYSDAGDIEYFIAGDYENALQDYCDAVDVDYDNGEIRYKIGYIQYSKKDYRDAIGSFMKAGEDYSNDSSLLLAMGNSLSLRNDDYAAEGYFERLIEQINSVREQKGVLFPQVRKNEAEIVDNYLKATNNLGVTLYRLAKRTGSSAMNAKAMVNFQESLRAWDSMTRNQQTLVRLGGSNLAEQNLKYVTHPMPEFEPAIYTDLPKTLTVEEGLSQ